MIRKVPRVTVLAQDHCYSVLLSITLTNLQQPSSVMIDSTLSTSKRFNCLAQSRMHGRSADEQSNAIRIAFRAQVGRPLSIDRALLPCASGLPDRIGNAVAAASHKSAPGGGAENGPRADVAARP